ncbi:MAG: hypothetical protein AMXMBFR82_03160 [Candidatus Hydrogenedentota bacterium]
MNPTITARLLSPAEAARYIGMSPSYLANSRCQGNLPGRTPAPPYIRIGRTIRYDVHQLDEWIEQHTHGGER